MSVWARVATEIKDIQTFLEVCNEHGLNIRESGKSRYDLTMKDGSGYATVECKDGVWGLSYDQDPKFSMFAHTYGNNGGVLMRDYASKTAKSEAFRMGLSIISEELKEDGSIRLVLGQVAV